MRQWFSQKCLPKAFWKENSKCHSSCAQFSDSSGIIAVLAEGCVSWIMWNIREIMIFGPFAPSFINAGQLMMINIIQTFSKIEGDFKQDHPKRIHVRTDANVWALKAARCRTAGSQRAAVTKARGKSGSLSLFLLQTLFWPAAILSSDLQDIWDWALAGKRDAGNFMSNTFDILW